MTARAPVIDKKALTGTAAASGGTATFDYAVPTDRALRIEARVLMTHKDAGSHIDVFASIYAEAVFKNNNGTVSLTTAIAGSQNPANGSNLNGSRAQAADGGFVGGGAGASTAVFSVSGTNARLTVTNNSDTGVAADVAVVFDAYIGGSV